MLYLPDSSADLSQLKVCQSPASLVVQKLIRAGVTLEGLLALLSAAQLDKLHSLLAPPGELEKHYYFKFGTYFAQILNHQSHHRWNLWLSHYMYWYWNTYICIYLIIGENMRLDVASFDSFRNCLNCVSAPPSSTSCPSWLCRYFLHHCEGQPSSHSPLVQGRGAPFAPHKGLPHHPTYWVCWLKTTNSISSIGR